MKKIIKFLLILILPFAFSSCDEEETPTVNNEVKITHISCLDLNGNEIDNIEYVIDQADYIYENIKVYAYYSDGSSGNVTPFVQFSEIDLATVGEKKVDVSYKGYYDSFIVNVLENKINRIHIDIKNVKIIYSINEELNITGLIVYEVLSDGIINEIFDYNVLLFDENSNEIKDKKINKKGTYLVQITYKNKYDYFNIYSFSNEYEYFLDIDKTNLNGIDLYGDYTYSNNDIIYENEYYYFTSYGDVILNILENNNDISFTYFNHNFDYFINLNSLNGLIYESKYDFEMVIIIEGINFNGELEICDLDEKEIEYYYINDNQNILIFINGSAGLYEIKAFGELKIKGIAININENIILEDIKLKTNSVQKTYLLNEKINYENLIIYGVINDIDFVEIPSSSCVFSLKYNGEYVTELNKIGLYEVEVSYMNFDNILRSCYNIEVKSKITSYKYLNLDLSNVQTVFEEYDVFNYNGLIVYGIDETNIELIDLSYCDIQLFYNDGISDYHVDDFTNNPGSYYVLVSYSHKDVKLTKTYDVYYTLNIIQYENDVIPNIEILENGNVNLYVENVLSTIIDVNFSIYSNGILITNVNSLNSTICNLDISKTYVIKGYYTGKINNQEYIVYINNTQFNFTE